MSTVLIVEDEVKIAELLADYFRADGHQPHMVHRGDEALAAFQNCQPDAVLLDLMLPGMDGLEICKEIRKVSNVPILMVTARVDEIDRLLGLELGADDYICKPFSPREVLARVKAVLRRCAQPSRVLEEEQALSLDEHRLQVSYADKALELTAVEFQLLRQLHSEPGRIFSRSQLMDRMYNDQRIVSDRTIDSHIKKLRKRMKELTGGADCIASVYGAGYKFEWPL